MPTVERPATPLYPEVLPSPSRSDPPDQFALLDDWRGDLTTFQGFTGTRPKQELVNLPWNDIKSAICPEKPTQIEDKKQGKYFVPCQLKEAPLVGNTLEAAEKSGEPTVGKMRSKTHMTEATFHVMDIDGLPRREFRAGIKGLKKKKISFLWYTTHSYGSPEKPGIRVRLIIFLNRPVDLDEYKAAWHGIDQLYFNGHAGKADSSGANMYQQQGFWCCHPSRVNKARARRFDAGLADVDALIAAGEKEDTVTGQHEVSHVPIMKPAGNSPSPLLGLTTYPESDAHRIADRCAQIGNLATIVKILMLLNPDICHPDWIRVGMIIFNTTSGSADGLDLFDSWSSSGKKYRGRREIESKWRSFRLDVPKPVTIGTLIHIAKSEGIGTLDLLQEKFEPCETVVISGGAK